MSKRMSNLACLIALFALCSVGCGGEENNVVEAPADWQPSEITDTSINDQLSDEMNPEGTEIAPMLQNK